MTIFSWIKLAKYSSLSSALGISVIIPVYGYLTLLKKSEESNKLLTKTTEELEEAKSVLEKAKKINDTNSEEYSELENVSQTVKSEKQRLVTKSNAVISGIEVAFKKIKENYDNWFGRNRKMTTWKSKMEANEKLVEELEKLIKDNQ